MKPIIIGINGKRQSGKDTIANMIAYIHKVGIAKANYQEWANKPFDNEELLKAKSIHFADALKNCISIIYNIPIDHLYKEFYKDEVWYCLDTSNYYYNKDVINHQEVYDIIEYNDLQYGFTLASRILKNPNKLHVIKIRTLLQYFGTDMCRYYLGDDIWVRTTISKAVEIAETQGICIIPDIRFENEAKAIQQHSLYGGAIKVIRNNNKLNDDNSRHVSETTFISCPYVITNDTTLFSLFYKVLDAYQNIIARYENH